ncbi:MAG TPA: SpoIIE family protein phosphatase [Streptosporangiaceae bacterium]|nr:SpoIIE family protein phosphatase [Streptosporangiaceae bacterium]
MSETPEPVAGLEARYAALRQAARSDGGDPGDVLEAAFAELEGAIDLLRAVAPVRRDDSSGTPSDAERGLLRAVFQDAPVAQFLVARDGTVQRVNRAAGDMIGAKPGYATGRPFTAFVALPSRAAVNSQLTAVGRTGQPRRIRCSLVAGDGLVPCELVIGRVGVKGNPDESDPLLIAARDATAADVEVKAKPRSQLGAVQAITRRLDLITALARLLLENEGYSESRTLQRCARLIAGELTAWVIVDMDRRHQVRRQFVAGPDDPQLAELTSALAAVDPPPGSVPCTVQESGHPALVAHADDADALGRDVDGESLLTRLDATSLLSVPLTDGEIRYGVLTLARRASDGHFKVADLALVQELGEQMGLAIRVDRMVRRRSDAAYALHASVQPRRWPDIPGVQIAATYLAATEDADVGGDFYDVYRTPDGWGLAVGDVSGKGEEAAAVTAAARYAIRVLARRHADPGEVLVGANEIVLADELALDGGFVTAGIAHLSWQEDSLGVVLGSSGHPPAVVLRSDGRVTTASGGGLPLGLFPDAEPATQELVLDHGDILFLYTDGVAQARGPDNTYFQDRLADELAVLAGRDPEYVVARMRRAMNDFTGEHYVDDVTMLVMRAGQRHRRRAASRRRAPG